MWLSFLAYKWSFIICCPATPEGEILCLTQLAPRRPAGECSGSAAAVSTVVEHPTYVSNSYGAHGYPPRSRIVEGKYCDLGEWLQVLGAITSGNTRSLRSARRGHMRGRWLVA
jgi:hypothetical protein